MFQFTDPAEAKLTNHRERIHQMFLDLPLTIIAFVTKQASSGIGRQ